MQATGDVEGDVPVDPRPRPAPHHATSRHVGRRPAESVAGRPTRPGCRTRAALVVRQGRAAAVVGIGPGTADRRRCLVPGRPVARHTGRQSAPAIGPQCPKQVPPATQLGAQHGRPGTHAGSDKGDHVFVSQRAQDSDLALQRGVQPRRRLAVAAGVLVQENYVEWVMVVAVVMGAKRRHACCLAAPRPPPRLQGPGPPFAPHPLPLSRL